MSYCRTHGVDHDVAETECLPDITDWPADDEAAEPTWVRAYDEGSR